MLLGRLAHISNTIQTILANMKYFLKLKYNCIIKVAILEGRNLYTLLMQ